MPRHATKLWLLFIASPLIVGAGILAVLWPWPFYDVYHVELIKVDDSYVIELTADVFWERSQAIYFEVHENGRSLHHYRVLGFTNEPPGDLDFRLLATPDRSFFAIVESSNPDVVLMFFDTSTRERWPGTGGPPWDQHYIRMNNLIDKLRQHYPTRDLVLSHQVPGNRPLRIRG
jgi:hypothetical protein